MAAVQRPLGFRASGFLVLCLAVSGCAVNYVDASGARHILGLAHVTIPASTADRTGESVRIQSIGLSVYESPLHRGIVLGYSDEALSAIGDTARRERNPVKAD